MDASRFDDLLRTLSRLPSRRAFTRTATGLGLSGILATRMALHDAEAKKKKKRKKKKKKQGPSATCSDNVKNGSESDTDCGGSCPRCDNGKTCTGRNDCAGAFCANGICAECSTTGQCGADQNGQCFCEQTIGGPKTCNQGGKPVEAESCEACPAGMRCIAEGGGALCVKLCGAP